MVTWSPKVNVSEEVCLSQGVKGVHLGSDASFFLCGTANLLRACSHFWERSGDGVVVCSLTSIQEARGKRSNHLLVSLSAIAEDKTKATRTQFRNCA